MSGNKYRKSNLRHEMIFLPENVSNIQNCKTKSGCRQINFKSLTHVNNTINKVPKKSIRIKSSFSSEDQHDKEDQTVERQKCNNRNGNNILHRTICANSAYSLHSNLKWLQYNEEINKYKKFTRYGKKNNVNKYLSRQNSTAFIKEYMAGDNELIEKNIKPKYDAIDSDRSKFSNLLSQKAKQLSVRNARRRPKIKPKLSIRHSSLTKSQIFQLKAHVQKELKTTLSYNTMKHGNSEKYNSKTSRLRNASVKKPFNDISCKKTYTKILSNTPNKKINTSTKMKSNDPNKTNKILSNLFRQDIGNTMTFWVKQKKMCNKNEILKTNGKICNHQFIKHHRSHSIFKYDTETNQFPQTGHWSSNATKSPIKVSTRHRDRIILTAINTLNKENKNNISVLEDNLMTSGKTLTSRSKQQTNSLKKLICQLWDDQSKTNIDNTKSTNRNFKMFSSSCSRSRRSVEIKKMLKEIKNQKIPCVKANILNTGEDEPKLNELTVFKKFYGYMNIFGNKRIKNSHCELKFIKSYSGNMAENVDTELINKTLVKSGDIECTKIKNKKRESVLRKKCDYNTLGVFSKKYKKRKSLRSFVGKFPELDTTKVLGITKKLPQKHIRHSSSSENIYKTKMAIRPKRDIKLNTENNIPVRNKHKHDVGVTVKPDNCDKDKNLRYYGLINNTSDDKILRTVNYNKKVTHTQNSEIGNSICNIKADYRAKNLIKSKGSPFDQDVYHHATRLTDFHRKIMKQKKHNHNFSTKRNLKFLDSCSDKTNKDYRNSKQNLDDVLDDINNKLPKKPEDLNKIKKNMKNKQDESNKDYKKEQNLKVIQDEVKIDELREKPEQLNKNYKPRKDSAIQWSNHDYFIQSGTNQIIDNHQTDIENNTLYNVVNRNKNNIQSKRENKQTDNMQSKLRIQIDTDDESKVRLRFSDKKHKSLPLKDFCLQKYQQPHYEDFLNDDNIKNTIKILRAKQNALRKCLQAFDDDIIRKKLEWYEKIKKELQLDLERRCKIICEKRSVRKSKSLKLKFPKLGGKIFLKGLYRRSNAAKKELAHVLKYVLSKMSAGKLNFEIDDSKTTIQIIKKKDSKPNKLKESSMTELQCECGLVKKSNKKQARKKYKPPATSHLQSEEDNIKQDGNTKESKKKSALKDIYLKASRSSKSIISNADRKPKCAQSNSSDLNNKVSTKGGSKSESSQDELKHIKQNIECQCSQLKKKKNNKNKKVNKHKSLSNENIIRRDKAKGDIICGCNDTLTDESNKYDIDSKNSDTKLQNLSKKIKRGTFELKGKGRHKNSDSEQNICKCAQSTVKEKKECKQQSIISKFIKQINGKQQVTCACVQMKGDNGNQEVDYKFSQSKVECICSKSKYDNQNQIKHKIDCGCGDRKPKCAQSNSSDLNSKVSTKGGSKSESSQDELKHIKQNIECQCTQLKKKRNNKKKKVNKHKSLSNENIIRRDKAKGDIICGCNDTLTDESNKYNIDSKNSDTKLQKISKRIKRGTVELKGRHKNSDSEQNIICKCVQSTMKEKKESKHQSIISKFIKQINGKQQVTCACVQMKGDNGNQEVDYKFSQSKVQCIFSKSKYNNQNQIKHKIDCSCLRFKDKKVKHATKSSTIQMKDKNTIKNKEHECSPSTDDSIQEINYCGCTSTKQKNNKLIINYKNDQERQQNNDFEIECVCQKLEENVEDYGYSQYDSMQEISLCRCTLLKQKNSKVKINCDCRSLKDTCCKKHKTATELPQKKGKIEQERQKNSDFKIVCVCQKSKENVKHATASEFLLTKFKHHTQKTESQSTQINFVSNQEKIACSQSKHKNDPHKIYCECNKLREKKGNYKIMHTFLHRNDKTNNQKRIINKEIECKYHKTKDKSVKHRILCKFLRMKCKNIKPKIKTYNWQSNVGNSPKVIDLRAAQTKHKNSKQKIDCRCLKFKGKNAKHLKPKGIDNKLANESNNFQSKVDDKKEIQCGCVKLNTRSTHLSQKNHKCSKSSLQKQKHLKNINFVKCNCFSSKGVPKIRKSSNKGRNNRKKRKSETLAITIKTVKNCLIDTYHVINNNNCYKNGLGLTLKKRPCFILYKICPWLYPYFLNCISCTKQTFRLCMLGFGFMCWLPCMLCTSCLFCKKCC